MKEVNFDFVLRVLHIASEWDLHGSIWWRTDGEYAPVTYFVNSNDIFTWGCADAETITEENIDELEQSLKDAEAATKNGGMIYGPILFCARVNKMRPQGAVYPASRRELWPLLDACGPERETGFGNPYKPGERSIPARGVRGWFYEHVRRLMPKISRRSK